MKNCTGSLFLSAIREGMNRCLEEFAVYHCGANGLIPKKKAVLSNDNTAFFYYKFKLL